MTYRQPSSLISFLSPRDTSTELRVRFSRRMPPPSLLYVYECTRRPAADGILGSYLAAKSLPRSAEIQTGGIIKDSGTPVLLVLFTGTGYRRPVRLLGRWVHPLGFLLPGECWNHICLPTLRHSKKATDIDSITGLQKMTVEESSSRRL